MYQLDANNFIMILSHKWPLHVSDIYMSIFTSSYMLFHCRMWCYAIGVEAVVLRSWCVVWCTVCQLVSNWLLLAITISVRQIPIAVNTVLRLLMMDSKSVRKMYILT